MVTPQPRATVTGLDRDVIALLESGKNVVTSAAYSEASGSARARPPRCTWCTRATSAALLHERGVLVLGPNQEYGGSELPFGGFTGPISYTIEIAGRTDALRMQLAMGATATRRGSRTRRLPPLRAVASSFGAIDPDARGS